MAGDPDHLAPGRGDHRPGPPAARRRPPGRHRGHRPRRAVTGRVAIGVDFSDYLAERLPWFFGAVLGLSFLLLMVVFRSLLVPLKAVIMNLLSIGAAYGVVVAIFQWGWGGGLLGIEPAHRSSRSCR